MRNAPEFMFFRYAIKKSLLRLIGKQTTPEFSERLFKRKLRYFYHLNFENRFLGVKLKSKKSKKLLFFFFNKQD